MQIKDNLESINRYNIFAMFSRSILGQQCYNVSLAYPALVVND